VVAQICGSYETVDLGATQAVAEILSRYLIELGYAAHRYAEIGVGPSSFKLFGFVYLNLFFKLVAAYSRVSNNRAELL